MGSAGSSASFDDLAGRVGPTLFPCIQLRSVEGESTSFLGGLPPRSVDELEWPRRQGRPLSLLACLDLRDVPESVELRWLPRSGSLLFFCDLEELPCGLGGEDGAWRVLHVQSDGRSGLEEAPAELDPKRVLPRKPVELAVVQLPPPDIDALADRLDVEDDRVVDRYSEYRESLLGARPWHQLGGIAESIQDADLREECEYGRLRQERLGREPPRVPSRWERLVSFFRTPQEDPVLRARAGGLEKERWQLLLQLDSDDELGVQWLDAGRGSFFVRLSESGSVDFEETWFILETH